MVSITALTVPFWLAFYMVFNNAISVQHQHYLFIFSHFIINMSDNYASIAKWPTCEITNVSYEDIVYNSNICLSIQNLLNILFHDHYFNLHTSSNQLIIVSFFYQKTANWYFISTAFGLSSAWSTMSDSLNHCITSQTTSSNCRS